MSSIIVYGDSSSDKRIIDRNTVPKPSNFYGNSKLQAEEGINPLEDNNFKVVILRPPMIYDKNSNINDKEGIEALKAHQINWLFIIGWSQIVKNEILNSPTYGCIPHCFLWVEEE